MVQDYLRSKFKGRFFYKEKWPPDLNPCDFFLWGYLKERVYEPKPDLLEALKSNIERECKKISKEMLKSTFEKFSKRLTLLKSFNGNHIEDK